MKQNRYALFAALVLGSFSSFSHGAFYATNFEPPAFTLGNLDGQSGWTVNATSVEGGIGVVAPVITPLTPFGTRSASLGFTPSLVLDSGATDVYASYRYGGSDSTPLLSSTVGTPATSFSAIFQIYDSDSGYGTGAEVRDNFGFRLQNAAGYNLFSIVFTPFRQAIDAVPPTTPENEVAYNQVSWSTGTGLPQLVAGGYSAQEGQSYTFGVTFAPSVTPGNVAFSANISGVNFFSGDLVGLASEEIKELGAFWKPTSSLSDPGSNSMVFDNINVVPEPSSALLGLLGASFAFLRRRRN